MFINAYVVATGLDNIFNKREEALTIQGYIVNLLIVVSCLFAFIFPFFDFSFLPVHSCIFKQITTLPCPGCGYSRSMIELLNFNLIESLLFNPALIFIILFQATMIYVGAKSIIDKKQTEINGRYMLIFLLILGANWIAKFMLGAEFY